MKNWAIAILTIISVACIVVCAVMYTDNRRLLDNMAEKSGGCQDDRRFESLLEICETMSQINRQQNSYLRRVRGKLEEIDEQRRQHSDGKVWSASGRRENRGPGKGREGVGGP